MVHRKRCLGSRYMTCGLLKHELKLGNCGARAQVSFLENGMRRCTKKPYRGVDLRIERSKKAEERISKQA